MAKGVAVSTAVSCQTGADAFELADIDHRPHQQWDMHFIP
jgi:hypothetical protein